MDELERAKLSEHSKQLAKRVLALALNDDIDMQIRLFESGLSEYLSDSELAQIEAKYR